jgi:hypothetical protein
MLSFVNALSTYNTNVYFLTHTIIQYNTLISNNNSLFI